MGYLLGYDIGTSSVKASLVDAVSGEIVATTFYPENEAPIIAKQMGWAEQEPDMWWTNLIEATKKLGTICGIITRCGRPGRWCGRTRDLSPGGSPRIPADRSCCPPW